MDDRMIDRYITQQIKKRGITAYDIIGGPSIDPEPNNWARPYNERVRCNRFQGEYPDYRLCELLTERDFNPDNPYENLTISVNDLVRYWWNNLADQEAIIADAFEDILAEYKDRMLLEKEGEEGRMDINDALDEIFFDLPSRVYRIC